MRLYEIEDKDLNQAINILIDMVDSDSLDYEIKLYLGLDEEDTLTDEQVEEWANDKIHDMNYYFEYKLKYPLIVYRRISVPNGWDIKNQHPGIYWSYDENAAEAHWGKFDSNHKQILLVGEIVKSDIDWPITLAQNANPSYEDEKEIRIKKVSIPKNLRYTEE